MQTSHPIDLSRTAHMIGVAEYMYNNASRYKIDPEKAYIIGLLHDIGYISGIKDGHEHYGAELIQKCFSTNFGMPYIGEIIYNHGVMPFDYMNEHKCDADEIPPELVLLWEADMMVDLTGKPVGFEQRLSDIGERHGFDSRPYKVCHSTIEWLKGVLNSDES